MNDTFHFSYKEWGERGLISVIYKYRRTIHNVNSSMKGQIITFNVDVKLRNQHCCILDPAEESSWIIGVKYQFCYRLNKSRKTESRNICFNLKLICRSFSDVTKTFDKIAWNISLQVLTSTLGYRTVQAWDALTMSAILSKIEFHVQRIGHKSLDVGISCGILAKVKVDLIFQVT